METSHHYKNGASPKSHTSRKNKIKIMKRVTVFIVLGFLFTSLSSFHLSNFSDYGPWTTTSCFKGLDFCVKKASYNEYARKYEWWVKFRNRYSGDVSFNCALKESYVNSAKTTDRVTVRASSEGGSIWFLVADANSVKVFIDDLRFGNDDWGTNYASCDN